MKKKYELTDDCYNFRSGKLYRIRALRDFGSIKAGNLGGYIESESNLSHDGNAWVSFGAMVFDNAKVYDNANVFGSAMVYGESEVFGNAMVYCHAKIYDYAKVFDNANISDNANVFDNSEVYGNAIINGYANISCDTKVCDAIINFDLEKTSDYITIGYFGDYDRSLTISIEKGIINCGCFSGTLDEFKKSVDADYKGTGNYYTAIKMIESIWKK